MAKKANKSDFIGCEVQIGEVHGRIIDETKHIIIVRDTKNNEKKFVKSQHIFKIKINDSFHEIIGLDINNRPEDRLKKK